MKTAVSIPDHLFKIAERTAAQLNISRSRLFAMALEEFVYNHSMDEITQRLNEVYVDNSEKTDPSTYSIENLKEITEHDSW